MVDRKIIEIAERFVEMVPEELQVQRSYLFGSYAKSAQHLDSDIDIALVLNNMGDFFETQMKLMKLRRKIELRIEPHPIRAEEFNPQNPFAYEIQKTGIELGLKKTN
jgi:predicted nucleotidyltransferase